MMLSLKSVDQNSNGRKNVRLDLDRGILRELPEWLSEIIYPKYSF